MSDTNTPWSERLNTKLDTLAKANDLPSLVVADDQGLLVAASDSASQADEVAALCAVQENGVSPRKTIEGDRVKARTVVMGERTVVMGALGDTAICAAVFDVAEEAVKELAR